MVSGHTIYNNIRTLQYKDFQIPFLNFFNNYKIDLIIEIGTAEGGLTKFLSDVSNTKIITYDPFTNPNFDGYLIEHRQKNIFEDIESISELIKNNNLVLVLCDGGNKVKEFKTFATLIKSGDFIFGHDYAKSFKYFKENLEGKKWNWLELNREDIEEDIIKNNLFDFMSEDFNEVMWGSFKKL